MGRFRAGILSAASLLLLLVNGTHAYAHDTCATVARAPTVTWGAARAEHLETDATVSEAEAVEKRKSAVENRRIARELRARAIKIVREGAIEDDGACDPPFRFTAGGRKIYRLECLE